MLQFLKVLFNGPSERDNMAFQQRFFDFDE